jgi:hypothetical protein
VTITTINYATVFKFLSQTKNIDYARRWLTFIGFPYEDEKLKLFFGCQHSDKSIRKLKITVDELEYDMFETFQLSARFLVLKDREAVWQSILEEIQDAFLGWGKLAKENGVNKLLLQEVEKDLRKF